MQERFFYLGQNMDEIPHIFSEVQIFPMAEIEASLIFNTLDGVDCTVGIELRGHLHIVDGADHDSIAGNGSALAHFDAGSLQQNVWLNVVGCKKLFLYRIDVVAWSAGDKSFAPGFADFDGSS